MAKTMTRKPARPRSATNAAKASPKRAPSSQKPDTERRARSGAESGRVNNSKSAADALIGLLESPLVADILAAGAAAALAAFTASRVSRRRDGGSKQALKNAAKAAAAAMGTRISEEIDEILKTTKAARRAAK